MRTYGYFAKSKKKTDENSQIECYPTTWLLYDLLFSCFFQMKAGMEETILLERRENTTTKTFQILI